MPNGAGLGQVRQLLDVRQERGLDVQVRPRPVGRQLWTRAQCLDELGAEEPGGQVGVRADQGHPARVPGGQGTVPYG